MKEYISEFNLKPLTRVWIIEFIPCLLGNIYFLNRNYINRDILIYGMCILVLIPIFFSCYNKPKYKALIEYYKNPKSEIRKIHVFGYVFSMITMAINIIFGIIVLIKIYFFSN